MNTTRTHTMTTRSRAAPKELGVANAYQLIDPKLLAKKPTWPELEQVNLEPAKRLILVGRPGSGKSSWVWCFANQIMGMRRIDTLLLFCASYDSDPLYQDLVQQARKHGVKGIIRHDLDDLCACGKNEDGQAQDGRRAVTSDGESDSDEPTCPKLHVTDLDPKLNHLMVCEDLIGKNKRALQVLTSFWVMGRRQNLTSIFSTQNNTSAPIEVRRTSDYIVVKQGGMHDQDLQCMLSSMMRKQDVPRAMNLWRRICATNDKSQFMLLDMNNADPHLKVRWNYRRTDIGLE